MHTSTKNIDLGLGDPQQWLDAPPSGEAPLPRLAAYLSDRDLFALYKDTPTKALLEQITERFLPTVGKMAERRKSTLPASVELGDLIQAGSIGLLESIKKFDLERGCKFETYMAPAVYGRMGDFLRDEDILSRNVRHAVDELHEMEGLLEAELGRAPTADEIIRALDITEEDFIELRQHATVGKMPSLEAPTYQDGDKETHLGDKLAIATSCSPLQKLMSEDLFAFFEQGLDAHERDVLYLMLKENLDLKEIGFAMDLSESRISQIFSHMIDTISDRLAQEAPAQRGTLFWEIQNEFGKLERKPDAAFMQLSRKLAETIDRLNAGASIQFNLADGGEAYQVGNELSASEIRTLAAAAKPKEPALPSTDGNDFGFTFVD